MHNLEPRTELNVGAWFARSEAQAVDSEAVSLRIYQETDFREELLRGSSIQGAIQNQRERYNGKPASVYVLENRGGTSFWSTTGEYVVDFAVPGRVRGEFTATMDPDSEDFPAPLSLHVRFDGPVDLRCFRARSLDGDTQTHDREFESECCAPFANFDGVE